MLLELGAAVFLGGEPAFEAMALPAAQVIDFHGNGFGMRAQMRTGEGLYLRARASADGARAEQGAACAARFSA
ncbi:hypothetical protein NCCP691_11530 [Noviherbaspirillum aridicola]|uniref:Uncharacterized protein n=1 Tax=Noviherbaspirillum aridicola TaxID=2849687 RepID=A0ABQ4Q309_9BURK|nr:hypothetical protein NCCP691_11530 [Noviherbaspirillum aridicola]